MIPLVEGGQPAAGHRDAGLDRDAPGLPFVVAATHRDGRGELRQRLAGNHAAPAVGEAQFAGLGVEHLHLDPASQRLVGNDPGVRVQVVDGLRRRREKRLVDGVLALDAQHRDALETELLVQRDRRGVVVHHGQVQVRASRGAVVLGQRTSQHFANARQARRGVDCQRPQAGAVFGVVEQPLVIDPGDGADHGSVVVTHGDQIRHRLVVDVVGPDLFHPRGHHPAAHVDAVHFLRVLRRFQRADGDSGRRPGQGFTEEAQPVGVARIDEELVRRAGHDDVRLAGVHADVAASRPLASKHLGEVVRVGERLPEDQTAPAEVEHHVIRHRVDQVGRRRVVQSERDRFGTVVAGFRGCAHPVDSTGSEPPAVDERCCCRPRRWHRSRKAGH